ncbi:MAG: OmpA family protein, partial [Muribaculaceae bacterium]|nr:OmpA family protein [Muribaculaceae bacterium]
FVPAGDNAGHENWNGYFQADDELLTTGDGAMVAVNKMWTKPSFERLVSHASQYGVEIAQFEAADGAGKKGGFRLEYLNGYVPPVPEPKRKGMPVWLWIALGLLAVGIIALLLLPRDEKVVEVEKIVEKEVVVRDTVYVQQIEDIESAFNAAKFAVNSAELNDDAKLALHDLAKVMKQNPELRLRIEGHT